MREDKHIRCTYILTHMFIHALPSIPAEPTLPIPLSIARFMGIRKGKKRAWSRQNASTSGYIFRIPQRIGGESPTTHFADIGTSRTSVDSLLRAQPSIHPAYPFQTPTHLGPTRLHHRPSSFRSLRIKNNTLPSTYFGYRVHTHIHTLSPILPEPSLLINDDHCVSSTDLSRQREGITGRGSEMNIKIFTTNSGYTKPESFKLFLRMTSLQELKTNLMLSVSVAHVT